jgi:hydrophobic/amphiphilic exporter-1 (mainly G- bacteria), HAE1 family
LKKALAAAPVPAKKPARLVGGQTFVQSNQDITVGGIILRIGIVKKNGIMIVDVALRLERDARIGAKGAVVQASHVRLRPILMTTACAMLAGIPMILGAGTGSEFRQPLGFAIVGGLFVSQVLALFTTPAVYIYLDRQRTRGRGEEPGPALAQT